MTRTIMSYHLTFWHHRLPLAYGCLSWVCIWKCLMGMIPNVIIPGIMDLTYMETIRWYYVVKPIVLLASFSVQQKSYHRDRFWSWYLYQTKSTLDWSNHLIGFGITSTHNVILGWLICACKTYTHPNFDATANHKTIQSILIFCIQ